MEGYFSMVVTGYEKTAVKSLERILKSAGIESEFSEFRPLIPQLKHSFSLTIKSDWQNVEPVRRRLKMALSAVQGGSEMTVTEFEIQEKRR